MSLDRCDLPPSAASTPSTTAAWLPSLVADLVVVLLPDSGFRYLSKTYNDDWMRGHGFLDDVMEMSASRVLASVRGGHREICSVATTQTVGDAIGLMAGRGISQLPVLEDGVPVGSVTETGILSHLIESPGVRGEPVGSIMEESFPVVSPRLGLAELSTLLDQELGAVLVETPAGFEIITF